MACDFLSEDLLKLLECLPGGASLHSINNQTLWVSQKSAELLSCENDKLIGSQFFNEVNPQDLPKIFQAISECILGESEQCVEFRTQFASLHKAQELRNFELKLSPYKHEKETLCLAMLCDITSKNHSEISLGKESKVEQNLNDVDPFFAQISHELRTPLNAISGFSQILMGESHTDLSEEKRTEYAHLINQSSTHLLQLVNEVLDDSKIRAGKFELNKVLFDANIEIQSVLKLMQPIADKSEINLSFEIDEAIPKITADQRAFRQILINLVANAIKFSKECGTVEIKATRKLRKIHLEISDHGIGMTPTTLANLGNAYYQAEATTTNKREGTGLGLSIVSNLVNLHEGKLAFESVIGKGTKVQVELSIASQANASVPSNPNDEIIYLNKSKEPNLLRRLDKYQAVRKTG